MNKTVKIQNTKNPKIVMEVKKDIAGTYVGTHEWKIIEEKQIEEKPKDSKLFGDK